MALTPQMLFSKIAIVDEWSKTLKLIVRLVDFAAPESELKTLLSAVIFNNPVSKADPVIKPR